MILACGLAAAALLTLIIIIERSPDAPASEIAQPVVSIGGGATDAATKRRRDAFAAYERGAALHKRGDDAAAVGEFEDAIHQLGNEAVFHLALARSLDTLGRGDEARSEYERYLTLAPDAPDAAAVRAHLGR
ncbi:MAG TPA: tetratricopeptide repeat protein [Vicinamibacterales bacterium]|nr:tetratricopeptide repeat protein [Vicinamibacterales bacterium]